MQQQTPNKPRITVIEVSISPPYKSMTVQGGTAHPVYSHRNKNTFSFDVTQLTFYSCDIFDEEDEDEDEEPDWIPIINCHRNKTKLEQQGFILTILYSCDIK